MNPALPITPARYRTAVLGLVVACAAWGWSFPAMKWALHVMTAARPEASQSAVTVAFMAMRFPMAALCYGLLTFKSQCGYTRADLKVGFLPGILAGIGMIFQALGLVYVYPSVSGFLTALCVVTLPVAEVFLFGKRVRGLLWLACILALAGLVCLSLGGESSAANASALPVPFPYFGEALTILATFFFSTQILLLGRWGEAANSQRATFLFISTVGMLNLLIALCWPEARSFLAPAMLKLLLSDWTFQWTLLSTILICTVVAFHFMNQEQPKVSATIAGVIYCMEPVFASLFSLGLGAESWRWSLGLGGGMILVASLMAASASGAKQESVHPMA